MGEAAFRAALDALYRQFAAPAPASIKNCPCCLSSGAAAVLHTKPLRELQQLELVDYAQSVFLTVGAEADFRYFLPRILELSALEPAWSPQITVGKLKLAGWLEWEAADRACVEAFLKAWWRWRLEQSADANPDADVRGHAFDLEGVFCAIARTGAALDPFLEDLAAYPQLRAAMAELFLWPDWEGREPFLNSAFWDEIPDAAQQFAGFLRVKT